MKNVDRMSSSGGVRRDRGRARPDDISEDWIDEMNPESADVAPKSEGRTRPTLNDGGKHVTRLKKAYLGTGGIGLLCVGWGVGAQWFGLTPAPVGPEFLLGFGIALLGGSFFFWLQGRSLEGRSNYE